jgi:hypothetical protein
MALGEGGLGPDTHTNSGCLCSSSPLLTARLYDVAEAAKMVDTDVESVPALLREFGDAARCADDRS